MVPTHGGVISAPGGEGRAATYACYAALCTSHGPFRPAAARVLGGAACGGRPLGALCAGSKPCREFVSGLAPVEGVAVPECLPGLRAGGEEAAALEAPEEGLMLLHTRSHGFQLPLLVRNTWRRPLYGRPPFLALLVVGVLLRRLRLASGRHS